MREIVISLKLRPIYVPAYFLVKENEDTLYAVSPIDEEHLLAGSSKVTGFSPGDPMANGRIFVLFALHETLSFSACDAVTVLECCNSVPSPLGRLLHGVAFAAQ